MNANEPDDGDYVFEWLNRAEQDPRKRRQVVWAVRRRRHPRIEELLEYEEHFRGPVVAIRLVRLDFQMKRLKMGKL